MDQYYYKRFGRIYGPFSRNELEKKWLLPETLIKNAETEHWKELSQAGELNDLLPAAKQRKKSVIIITALVITAIALFIIFLVTVKTYMEVIEQNISCKENITTSLPFHEEKKEEVVQPKEITGRTEADFSRLKPLPVVPIKVKNQPNGKIYIRKLEMQKRDIRNRIHEYLRLNNSSYHTDENGVTDINVVLTNTTVFQFDDAEITLQYLDNKGTIIDMQTVSFRTIKPLATVCQQVASRPKVNKIIFTISSAHSKSLNLCFPNPAEKKDEKDPYYCK